MTQSKEKRKNWILIQQNSKRLFGPEEVDLSQEDVIVLVRIKNGEEYIIPFINHYLQLGVKHLFFLDNGSSDKTLELASQFKEVTVLQTLLPYKQYKMAFFHFLLRRFGMHCWSIVVDIDEFFDYPFSEFIPVSALIPYLNKHHYQAVAGQMLDMFPAKLPITDSPESFQHFKRDHIYYDLSDITRHLHHEVIRQNEWSNYNINIFRGGIRKKWFGPSGTDLSKFSLVRYDPNWDWQSIHHLHGSRVADFSTVLYHYKFRSDFKRFIKEAVKEEHYNRDSIAYKKMLEVIESNHLPTSLPPEVQQRPNVIALIEQNFLVVSDRYFQFAEKVILDQFKQLSPLPESTKEKLAYLIQILNLAIQKVGKTDDQLEEMKKDRHEELHREINKLKNTWTWKVGNAIVKPLKKITVWLRFGKLFNH
jgi:glycosyltransferase involved in cell wall biosynthesis